MSELINSNDEFDIVSLDEWQLQGGGANAVNYFHKTDNSIMLKVNEKPEDENIFIEEFETSKKVQYLNISTPKVLGLKRTDDGRLCIEYERIQGKKSIAALCAEHPDDIEKYARLFAAEAKKLHSTPCDKSLFPCHHDEMIEILETSPLITRSQRNNLLAFVDSLEETGTCLHADLHPGNLLLDENQKTYWIDVGGVSYGNPIYDMGLLFCMCVDMNFYTKLTSLIHMDKDQLARFWKAFSVEYLGSDDPEKIKKFIIQCKYADASSILYRMKFHTKKHEGLTDKLLYKSLMALVVLPK